MSVYTLSSFSLLIKPRIYQPNSKPFLVATWYRPPNSNVDKFNYFEDFIDMLDAENVEYYPLGDLNCDLGLPDLEGNSIINRHH